MSRRPGCPVISTEVGTSNSFRRLSRLAPAGSVAGAADLHRRPSTSFGRRSDLWIVPTPVKLGVSRRKEVGFLVRGRGMDPRTENRRRSGCTSAGWTAVRVQPLARRDGRDGLKPKAAPPKMYSCPLATTSDRGEARRLRVRQASEGPGVSAGVVAAPSLNPRHDPSGWPLD